MNETNLHPCLEGLERVPESPEPCPGGESSGEAGGEGRLLPLLREGLLGGLFRISYTSRREGNIRKERDRRERQRFRASEAKTKYIKYGGCRVAIHIGTVHTHAAQRKHGPLRLT